MNGRINKYLTKDVDTKQDNFIQMSEVADNQVTSSCCVTSGKIMKCYSELEDHVKLFYPSIY